MIKKKGKTQCIISVMLKIETQIHTPRKVLLRKMKNRKLIAACLLATRDTHRLYFMFSFITGLQLNRSKSPTLHIILI